jgi:hypothetical protein
VGAFPFKFKKIEGFLKNYSKINPLLPLTPLNHLSFNLKSQYQELRLSNDLKTAY